MILCLQSSFYLEGILNADHLLLEYVFVISNDLGMYHLCLILYEVENPFFDTVWMLGIEVRYCPANVGL